MLRNSESETEILLGNKQLLGIFFLLAVLLGIAFTGGFMIGRNGAAKKETASAVAQTPPPASAATNPAGGETHAVSPADAASNDTSSVTGNGGTDEQPLGAPRRKQASEDAPATPAQTSDFTPQSGQEFLQVAAVSRPDASEVAAVLRKKGFRAHAVPIAGNPSLYRVIVGPIRDAGDLANTRDSLRKTGFRQVIVQHYH